MKILLIEPPHKFWKYFKFHTASPGLAALAAYLERNFRVVAADFCFYDDPWAEMLSVLKQEIPDAVCITCAVFPHFYDALQTAALVKNFNPKIPVIGGGTVFTALAREALSTGNLDFVVNGEGEVTLKELLKALARRESDFSGIAGISYKLGGSFIANQPRGFIPDLNTLPVPAWHLFPMNRYHIQPLGGAVAFALTNSRGCYNRCSYCSETAHWQNQIRMFSGFRTAEHLEILVKNFGKTIFIFGDNDFLYDPARVDEFCREVEVRQIKARYWVQATTKSVIANRKLLPALKKAGCFNFQLGIESIDLTVQENYQKIQPRELILNAVNALHDAGISATGLYMWGDWNDTRETLESGVEFILKHFDFWAPNLINPFPGTEYYRKREEIGVVQERDFRRYNQYHVIMPTETMSREAVQEFYEKTAFSKKVAWGILKQALFSPHLGCRIWAREFILLDIKYNLFPWTRIPSGKTFWQYFKEQNLPLPNWEIQTPPWNVPIPERPNKPKKLEFK